LSGDPFEVETTPLTDPPSLPTVVGAASAGALPVTGAPAGDAVIDLRAEPLVDLRLIETPSEPIVGRRGLIEAAWWQRIVKRWVDVFGSFFLLLLLSPVLLISASAIKLSSRGPVLFVHERIGRGGVPFRMFKFRSMRVSAHESRGEVQHLNEAGGPVFKIREDPRITRVGRVLRKLSLDELPQLLNVLRGDMSLVGPRPPLPEECATYGPRERRRLAVTPGITCIWQVSGRSDLDFDTWVDMDLEYIDTWNVRRDLWLLLRTIPAVLSGRGAY
jgi:lipopolysaccharide/colanic/teichoic acid biosynthesis glycosyltransferase